MFHRKRKTSAKKIVSKPDNGTPSLSLLESLPDELLLKITHLLDKHALFGTLSGVSHRLRDASNWSLLERNVENIIVLFFRQLYQKYVEPNGAFIKNNLNNKRIRQRISSLKITINILMDGDGCSDAQCYDFIYKKFFSKLAERYTESSFKRQFDDISNKSSLTAQLLAAARRAKLAAKHDEVEKKSHEAIKKILYESGISVGGHIDLAICLLFCFQYELVYVSDKNTVYRDALQTARDNILDTLDRDQLAEYENILIKAHELSLSHSAQKVLQDAIGNELSRSGHRKAIIIASQSDTLLPSIFAKLSALTKAKIQRTHLAA